MPNTLVKILGRTVLWCRGVAIIAFAISMILSSTASARTLRSFQVGNWNVIALASNQTGAFSQCVGSTKFGSGIVMLFSVTGNFKWAISVLGPRMSWNESQRCEVSFYIDDDRLQLTASATAISARQIVVPLADDAELLDRIRKGKRLTISSGNEKWAFKLDDTNRLFQALLECARSEGKAPVVAPPPFQSAEKVERVGPSERSNNGALLAEAATVAANVLVKSGIRGFTLLSSEKAIERKSHAAWSSSDGSFGGLTIVPGNTTLAEAWPRLVIGRDAGRCKGNFLSGAIPEDGAKDVSRVFTTCQETGKESATNYYVGAPRKKGGVYVFSTGSWG